MSELPGRPDLDQLRGQARELHRAALGGDARALRKAEELIAGQYIGAATVRIPLTRPAAIDAAG